MTKEKHGGIKRVNVNLVTGAVIALIVIGFLLPVGMYIYYQGYSTVSSQDLGTTGNATRSTVNTNVWGAFNLLSVSPTLVGAGAVITILFAAFAFIYRRR